MSATDGPVAHALSACKAMSEQAAEGDWEGAARNAATVRALLCDADVAARLSQCQDQYASSMRALLARSCAVLELARERQASLRQEQMSAVRNSGALRAYLTAER